jgi:hypothetical protein
VLQNYDFDGNGEMGYMSKHRKRVRVKLEHLSKHSSLLLDLFVLTDDLLDLILCKLRVLHDFFDG